MLSGILSGGRKVNGEMMAIAVAVMLLACVVLGLLIYYKTDLFARTYYVDDESDLLDMEGSRDTFILTRDIALTGSWIPIQKFRGTLDGDGHAITGLSVTDKWEEGGLFGVLKGTVRDLTVHVSLYGDDRAAIAERGGRIINVTVYGTISVDWTDDAAGIVLRDPDYVSGCTNYATIKGGLSVAGICCNPGKGTVTGCTNYGDITSCSYSTADAGGICTACWNGKIKDCVNHGDVWGYFSAGGIVGLSDTSHVSSCENFGAISSTYHPGDIIGYSN